MSESSKTLSKFTGLVVTYHDEKTEELSLLESDAGHFKIEDETLKVEYFKNGVQTQKGFPLCSIKNYEIYFDPSSTSEE